MLSDQTAALEQFLKLSLPDVVPDFCEKVGDIHAFMQTCIEQQAHDMAEIMEANQQMADACQMIKTEVEGIKHAHEKLFKKNQQDVLDYNNLLKKHQENVRDYNALNAKNNQNIDDYNAILKDNKSIIIEYNQMHQKYLDLIDEYNALVEKYNALL